MLDSPLHKQVLNCLLFAIALFVISCSIGNVSVGGVASAQSADVSAIELPTNKIRRDGRGAVIEIDYRGSEVTDDQLAAITALPQLRSLLLGGTKVTDAGLKTIGKVATLENLDLRDCAVGNVGLSHLTNLKKLKALRLSGKSGVCTVDDDGMSDVAKLPSLKVLAVDFLWMSEDGLQKLVPLQGLEELYMAETTIDNSAISLLENFPKLKKLRIAKNQIDDLSGLSKVRSLEDLDLSECAMLDDAAMTPLKDLTKLKKLNLWRVNISDAGIASIANLQSLESLNLDNTRLSDRGMLILTGLNELTFLHLGSTQISDAGLPYLSSLVNLKDLRVTRTAVTQEGVDKLKQSLPATKIQLKYVVPSNPKPTQASTGFEPLFNGENLDGWKGAVDRYEVVDGAIRCKQGQGGVLYTDRNFKDFVVRLQFRLPPGGNNGLAIRYPGHGNAAYQGMCELQVLDSEHAKYKELDPRQFHGSVYGMIAAKRGFLKPVGEWNSQEVTVHGSKIRVELNGHVIVDGDLAEVSEFLDDKDHPGKDLKQGAFGFAGHRDPVEFKDVQIKRLPD